MDSEYKCPERQNRADGHGNLLREIDDDSDDDDDDDIIEDSREIFDDDFDHQSVTDTSSHQECKKVKRKIEADLEDDGGGDDNDLVLNMPKKKRKDNDAILSELSEEVDDTFISTPMMQTKLLTINSIKKALSIKKTPLTTIDLNELKPNNNTTPPTNLNQTKLNKLNVSKLKLKPIYTPELSVEPIDIDKCECKIEISNPQITRADFSLNSSNDDLVMSAVERLESELNIAKNKENEIAKNDEVEELKLLQSDAIKPEPEILNPQSDCADVIRNDTVPALVKTENVFKLLWSDPTKLTEETENQKAKIEIPNRQTTQNDFSLNSSNDDLVMSAVERFESELNVVQNEENEIAKNDEVEELVNVLKLLRSETIKPEPEILNPQTDCADVVRNDAVPELVKTENVFKLLWSDPTKLTEETENQKANIEIPNRQTTQNDFSLNGLDDDLVISVVERLESELNIGQNMENESFKLINKHPNKEAEPGILQSDLSFDNNSDMSSVELVEAELNIEEITEKEGFTDFKWMRDWVATDFEQDNLHIPNNIEIMEVIKAENVLRFFWWDAFEDATNLPGTVFLFGKTYSEEAGNYVSCCVVVKNIDRKLYFLPRQFEKGTEREITSLDVYNEINDNIMKPRQVKEFKMKSVTKKFAFDPSIPTESLYFEVRYSAKYSSVPNTIEGKTFSKIFGTQTSYLEILLIEHKIKGPCWLDISNAEPVTNPISWCSIEVNCNQENDIIVTQSIKPLPPPPLVVAAINMRQAFDRKTGKNQVVMLSCVTNTKYAVDKEAPSVPFDNHFCVFMVPDSQQSAPRNLYTSLNNYTTTSIQKMDTENALFNYFITKFSKLDPDLVVGYDLYGYQTDMLTERLILHRNQNISKLCRIKYKIRGQRKLDRILFTGRLLCDLKISSKELIKSRAYEFGALCQSVLQLKEGVRIDFEPEQIIKLFENSNLVKRFISMTMQDTYYMLKILYSLNIIPLALQITNIAGNVMSRTLLGGRNERNEFLLLHAFSERNYIVPDKVYKIRDDSRKPTYSGGLVLEPKIGFYDHLVLLMDFNSLYPSIIQEFNICFTTISSGENDIISPDKDLAPGVLPTEIRKLVDHRREVKSLINTPGINSDLKSQYEIRQMALKLTANSLYGSLGYTNSRFYAPNLAALIACKGREILMRAKDLVEAMNYEVIYGDTDSLMINTNLKDYDQILEIGNRIKQEINQLYQEIRLDIESVFKYLLLLKKKMYATVTVTKNQSTEFEYKGLDVVRRDWSQLACETGKLILQQILNDQTSEQRFCKIHTHLTKLRKDLDANRVPLPLLTITKELSRAPILYPDRNSLPHVRVALRLNKEGGGHYRAGDTVSYVICQDGTRNSALQRAYHIEELKNSKGQLKIDTQYYLAKQILPVISRICEPLDWIDSVKIAAMLGLESFNCQLKTDKVDLIQRTAMKFKDADRFIYKCYSCGREREIDGFSDESFSILKRCGDECEAIPELVLNALKNQLVLAINSYVDRFESGLMCCEDPLCMNETNRLPMHFRGGHPVCTLCQKSVMVRKYTEHNLIRQYRYLKHIFNLNDNPIRTMLDSEVIRVYQELEETIKRRLRHCPFFEVNLKDAFSLLCLNENMESQADPP